MHLAKQEIQLKNFNEDMKDGFVLGHLAESITNRSIGITLERILSGDEDADSDAKLLEKAAAQVSAVLKHLTQEGFALPEVDVHGNPRTTNCYHNSRFCKILR